MEATGLVCGAEAGIEPARLAAGDFESGAVSRIHADLRAICSASVRGNSPSET